MVKGLVRKLPHHVVEEERHGMPSLLKVAAIYGANASGKSNLIRAMEIARRIIVDGVKRGDRLPITPFKLGATSQKEPSRFEFEIKVGNQYFAYGFVATSV